MDDLVTVSVTLLHYHVSGPPGNIMCYIVTISCWWMTWQQSVLHCYNIISVDGLATVCVTLLQYHFGTRPANIVCVIMLQYHVTDVLTTVCAKLLQNHISEWPGSSLCYFVTIWCQWTHTSNLWLCYNVSISCQWMTWWHTVLYCCKLHVIEGWPGYSLCFIVTIPCQWMTW